MDKPLTVWLCIDDMPFLSYSFLITKVGIMSNVVIGMLGGLNEIMHVKLSASFKHQVRAQ